MPAVLAAVLALVARFLVTKLITAFGIAFVTGGISAYLLNNFKSIILTQINSMSPTIYSITMIAGLGEALSIIFGAIAFKIALTVYKKIYFSVTGYGV